VAEGLEDSEDELFERAKTSYTIFEESFIA